MSRRPSRQREAKPKKFFDYSLMFIVIFLVCFGLVMLYSTSSYSGQIKAGDPAMYLKKQLFATVLGIAAMIAISKIDYHFWEHFALLGYISSIVLSTLVFFIGREVNGSRRWIYIGSLSFQPSEFAKLAVILFFAYVISKSAKSMTSITGMIKVILLSMPIVGLVGKNNLSSAIIIFGIAVVLIFIASPKYRQFITIAGVGIAFIAVFLSLESYRLDRLKVWRNPEKYEKGYQTLQGLFAIGSGGLFGKGLGESMQKLGFIPEAQNDMIFSIICEELGLFGAICVIMLFLLLIWRFMVIANNAKDLFGALLVVGVMAHIAIQVVLNIAVVTNTIPNTGITLPFISYGGTSVCFLLAEMGLVLSVSNGIRFE